MQPLERMFIKIFIILNHYVRMLNKEKQATEFYIQNYLAMGKDAR